MAGTRIGVIGAGAVAERHVATLGGFADVRVVGVADPDAERAGALARAAGARAHPDHRALLEAGGLDAVYVCVPPFAHGPPEEDVLAAGLPLFVEKPLALDLATAERLAERVAAAGVVTACGYHWRYLDTVERAAGLLAERPARLAVASWLDKVPPPPWWLRRDRSGGQVVEQTTHVLDLLRVLVGEVDEVFALATRTPRPAFPEADVDDVSVAALRFASGAVGTVASSCLLDAKRRAGVELVADGLVVELSETTLRVVDAGRSETTEARGDAKVRVDRDFVDAVQGREDRVRAPYAEALRTHRLACALSDAAHRG